MTIFFEMDGPLQLKPGYFSGPFANVQFKRVWWLWFGIGFVNMSLKEYHDHIKSGATEWVRR